MASPRPSSCGPGKSATSASARRWWRSLHTSSRNTKSAHARPGWTGTWPNRWSCRNCASWWSTGWRSASHSRSTRPLNVKRRLTMDEHHRAYVGGGLPPMAVDQSPMHRLKGRDGKLAPDSAGTVTNKRTATPPSVASHLPHGASVCHTMDEHRRAYMGGGLPPIAADPSPMRRLKDGDGKLAPDSAGTVTNKRTVTPPSGASPLSQSEYQSHTIDQQHRAYV